MDDHIHIESLREGLSPGLDPVVGAYLVQACLVCLERAGHTPGVLLSLSGVELDRVRLIWKENSITQQVRRTWNDDRLATEQGACALALLLIVYLTDYTVLQVSRQGTGFDYWLSERGSDARLFQAAARLEVSGIAHAETDSVIQSRVRAKIDQTTRTDDTGLPVFVVVVEFSRPEARMVER